MGIVPVGKVGNAKVCQLKIRGKKVAGKGKYQGIGPAARLSMAFHESQGAKALARLFQVNPSSVRTNRLLLAKVTMDREVEWLGKVWDFAQEYRPLSTTVRRKWDGAKCPVMIGRVEVQAKSKAAERSVADWELIVATFRITTCWRDDSIPILVLDCALPPVPVQTPSSDNLNSALFRSPYFAPIWQFIQKLQSVCELAFDINEVDGAFGNDRLHWHGCKL